jgi:hypothetical protein
MRPGLLEQARLDHDSGLFFPYGEPRYPTLDELLRLEQGLLVEAGDDRHTDPALSDFYRYARVFSYEEAQIPDLVGLVNRAASFLRIQFEVVQRGGEWVLIATKDINPNRTFVRLTAGGNWKLYDVPPKAYTQTGNDGQGAPSTGVWDFEFCFRLRDLARWVRPGSAYNAVWVSLDPDRPGLPAQPVGVKLIRPVAAGEQIICEPRLLIDLATQDDLEQAQREGRFVDLTKRLRTERCIGCSAAAQLACACGARYCSDACAARDWAAHRCQ